MASGIGMSEIIISVTSGTTALYKNRGQVKTIISFPLKKSFICFMLPGSIAVNYFILRSAPQILAFKLRADSLIFMDFHLDFILIS